MTALLAFLTVLLRRRKPVMLFGLYWSFCAHRSHRARLRCWRWFVYDAYCVKHIESCYSSCKTHAT